jgi:hypothetical protein
MKNLILVILTLSVLTGCLSAEKKKKKFYYEGLAPKVNIKIITNDSLKSVDYLQKDENRIKVVVEGGIQNIKNNVFVTSKNAIIKKDSLVKDEYIVIPQKEYCEIIVDIETFELYFWVNKPKGKRKKIVKEYPPKKYMIGYERYEVK